MREVKYEILNNISPNDPLWIEWKAAIREEGWVNGADDSALQLLPILGKNITARSKADGRFLGAVQWSENDGLAYMAFYIVRAEYRGLGIGSAIWKRALGLVPPGYTIGLRSVANMVEHYKSTTTPVEGQRVLTQRIRAADFIETAQSHLLQMSFMRW
ncbi:hypothetical protein Q1695_013497 [Nippostrongylus brasiliensis]|nr:hypothetical protein Q1695_013497 [Nippostrongylus brasiliensis]